MYGASMERRIGEGQYQIAAVRRSQTQAAAPAPFVSKTEPTAARAKARLAREQHTAGPDVGAGSRQRVQPPQQARRPGTPKLCYAASCHRSAIEEEVIGTGRGTGLVYCLRLMSSQSSLPGQDQSGSAFARITRFTFPHRPPPGCHNNASAIARQKEFTSIDSVMPLCRLNQQAVQPATLPSRRRDIQPAEAPK